jgi:hypothetical protein
MKVSWSVGNGQRNGWQRNMRDNFNSGLSVNDSDIRNRFKQSRTPLIPYRVTRTAEAVEAAHKENKLQIWISAFLFSQPESRGRGERHS